MRKCKHCDGNLRPETKHISGTDEIGLRWKCDGCNMVTFSEITDYIGLWVISEGNRKKRLRER